jgi:hypothetical protein
MGDAADFMRAERHELGFTEQTAEAATHAEAFPASVHRREHGCADDGIESGGVAAARGDRNSHCLAVTASRISRITSPDSAWRLEDFLEKTRFPSTSTSNTPPED